jgi:uracil-DNA glycosylase
MDKSLMKNKHKNLVKDSWLEFQVFSSSALETAYNLLKEDREMKFSIYPHQRNVWRSLNYFDVEDLKVVILGQDPYHDPGTANGLAFATSKTNYLPPSLRNILKKIQSEEIGDDALLTHALTTKDSTRVWGKRQAEQGVLLLNTALTVRRGQPGSHATIWKPVTDMLITEIMQKTTDVVWILWGAHAINLFNNCLKKAATKNNHIVVKSTHPSPFSADRSSKDAESFNNAPIFSKVNEHLKALQKETIKW